MQEKNIKKERQEKLNSEDKRGEEWVNMLVLVMNPVCISVITARVLAKNCKLKLTHLNSIIT